VLVDGSGGPLRAGWDGLLDPGVGGAQRLTALAVHACAEVTAKLTLSGMPEGSLPVLMALPEPRPGCDVNVVQRVAREVAAYEYPGSLTLKVEPIALGHAGALYALETAIARLQRGEGDLFVIAGVDSYLDADTLDWLDSEGRLSRDGVRGGLVPGEAAAALAIATERRAAALGLKKLSTVRGVGSSQEKRSVNGDEGLLGEGLSEAIRGAVSGLQESEKVDEVYSDINGERHRVDDWGFTALRLPNVFRDASSYVTAVGLSGDVGAAAGVLGCALAVEALHRGYANGQLALVVGSSDGGLRAAALLASARRGRDA
jgi:3-oxoacyl-[acyl-carrier-protein] synthase-1